MRAKFGSQRAEALRLMSASLKKPPTTRRRGLRVGLIDRKYEDLTRTCRGDKIDIRFPGAIGGDQ